MNQVLQTHLNRFGWSVCCLVCCLVWLIGFASAEEPLRAGAAKVEISPRRLPAIRNGGFIQSELNHVDDSLYARCLVLADGNETIAIAIVDSCMFPTDVCDAIKAKVTKRIGLPPNRILISATHTHSAPSVMSYCLGSSRDEAYTEFVVPRVADAIVAAAENMEPAKIGWTSMDASEHTSCRRWITRSDQMGVDPFGQQTVRAMMHPGFLNPNYVTPAGPIDPELFVVSVIAAKDNSPLCVMANFSMHYFGSSAGFSADYFGEVANLLESSMTQTAGTTDRDFVGIMSQGASGDLHWMNYGLTRKSITRSQYSKAISEKVLAARKQIEHRSDQTLAMAESRLKLQRRTPDSARLEWAKPLNAARASATPRNRPEVYAQQAQWIHENPETEVVLQAVRIGDLAIAALPNEVYGITGLKLKQQSPLDSTFNLELANGAEGYIPPPEQHRLGGYTTWPARTAGLEVEAEPKIVDAVLSLLESVSGKPRREPNDPLHAYARAVIELKPVAYWRLGDLSSSRALDAMGQHHAQFKGGVALCLPGPDADGFTGPANRSVYFAGGSLQGEIPELCREFSVSMCFWNGLPAVRIGKLGVLFSQATGAVRESLSIVGDEGEMARLSFHNGSAEKLGKTPLATRSWHHITLTATHDRYRVFLDGQLELETDRPAALPKSGDASEQKGTSFACGKFDGKLDEVVIFDRPFSPEQAQALYLATGITPPRRPSPPVVLDEKPVDVVSLKRYADAIQRSKPVAFWRLHDLNDNAARDEMGTFDAQYEPSAGSRRPGSALKNFNGGRVLADVSEMDNRYSVELWMRNELPKSSRPVTGYLFTRGVLGDVNATGDCLGIGGTHSWTGNLFVYNGNQLGDAVAGESTLVRGSWNHVVMTRDESNVKVYLNGKLEIDRQVPITYPKGCSQFQIGGRNDSFSNLQGMLDEVSLFDRVLSPAEIESHFQAAGVKEIDQPKTEKQEPPRPTSPDLSLKGIHIRDGYQVQLVACEPQVKDPVAIDWGPDGSLWVVEMADYPLGIDGSGKPGGRIRKLEDRDQDGRYETSKLFADGIPFPTGILVWGDGVLVTAAPEILYLEDSTGDGQADIRRALYKGFLEGNQQLRVNGLRWGLDNWVHCASGSHHSGYGEGSQITSTKTGQILAIGSRDFRVRPDTGEIEPLSGPSQFGRNRDDWGNWFGVQNSRPLWHYVLADHDIRRNPHFAPPDPKHQVVIPLNPPVYPAAKPQKRFHSFEHLSRFTSACSGVVYRDDLLFERSDEDQHAFTCEPFHNLVQHNIIKHDGVSFGFRRDPAELTTDFFASEDRWCRPVMVRTGPDGALWVVDMYRYMIEHPQWLPPEGKDELRPYYRSGEDHGRIYRVVTTSGDAARKRPSVWLGERQPSTDDLVDLLESPNGWWRDFAQRELIRRSEMSAVVKLQRLAITGKSPLARLHAMCTLDGLAALPQEVLNAAVADPHAGVRRHAARLASRWPVSMSSLLGLVEDPDAKVRLQLAATLGSSPDPVAVDALARLAYLSSNEPYIIANVMSSLTEQTIGRVVTRYLAQLTEGLAIDESQSRVRKQLLSQLAAMGDAESIGQIVELTCNQSDQPYQAWQLDSLADLLDGLTKRDFAASSLAQQHQLSIDVAIQEARLMVGNSRLDKPTPTTFAAIRLLLRQFKHRPTDLQLVAELMVPQVAVELQLATADRLGGQSDPQNADVLIARWSTYGPSMRARVLELLASRSSWSHALLDAIQSTRISSSELNATMRERLLATTDQAERSRWMKVLSTSTRRDRTEVVNQYRSALTKTGDADRGAKVFSQRCAACHRLGNVGHDVGPNLLSITDKSPQTLLTAILDPSAAVEARYLGYLVITIDGLVHSGLLTTETGSSLTLLTSEGKQETILRTEIDEIRASRKSLMPEGLENELTPQEIADVILLLRNEIGN